MGDDPELQSALNAAVGTLQRRERTTAELRAWLLERGTAEEIADEATAELIEIGELDDERFAYAFAEDKRDLSGWGRQRIEAALIDRGIGRDLAERAGSESHEAELERATGLVIARGEDLSQEAARARVLSYLSRRGFEYDLAYDAIRRAGRPESSAA
jgi:regulatory protein